MIVGVFRRALVTGAAMGVPGVLLAARASGRQGSEETRGATPVLEKMYRFLGDVRLTVPATAAEITPSA